MEAKADNAGMDKVLRGGGGQENNTHVLQREEVTQERKGQNSLSRLVSKASSTGFVLTTAKDVPNQTFSVEKALFWGGKRDGRLLVVRPDRPVQAGLDERPAATHPVTVTTIDELVCAPGKPAFGSILS